MTRYRITTRRGDVTATERDRWPQLDGPAIATDCLTTEHSLPGWGEVERVAVIVEQEQA